MTTRIDLAKQRAKVVLAQVEQAESVSLLGAVGNPKTKAMLFGGFGGVMTGIGVGAVGFLTAAKVLVIGGAVCMTAGFVRGYKEGVQMQKESQKEAEILLAKQMAEYPGSFADPVPTV